MFLAYCVYFFILGIMFLFSYNKRKQAHVIPIVLITLILGNRYNVGLDFPTYKFTYEYNYNEQYEILYRFLSEFLWNNGFSFYVLLSCTVLVYYSFFYASFKKISYIFPYCILFFMAFGPFTFMLNGIRQAISFSIFLYSIQFIWERKFFRYLIYILLATGIHTFSIVLLPIYLLSYLNLNKLKVFHLVVAYIITIFMGEFIFGKIINELAGQLKTFGYGVYSETFGDSKMSYGTGIGMLIMKTLDILLVLYFDKLKKYYKNTPFTIYYTIFFIGLLLYNIVGLDLLGNRAIYCFISIRFIVAGFLLYFVLSKSNIKYEINQIVACYFILSAILLFIANIYGGQNGCSPFNFNFLS